MKALLGSIAGLLLLLAPAAAFPMPVYIYGAVLSGGQEVPPNASAAWGGVTLIPYDPIYHKFRLIVSFSGLSGNSTAAHIHCCVADPGTVGVATQTPFFINFPIGVTSGTYSHLFDWADGSTYSASFLAANGGNPWLAWTTLFNAIKSDSAYFNIHSTVYPGGEIRGFFQTIAVDNFPEPATLALLGAGLLGVFRLRRVKRA